VGCDERTSRFNSEVFGYSDPKSIIALLQKKTSRVLLAWYSETEVKGEMPLHERVIVDQKDKEKVLAWLNRNIELLNSTPPPKEELGAQRPGLEMSVYKGDKPWVPTAKRIFIYNKPSLSRPAFREIQNIFMEKGKQKRSTEQ
jgi:hypothetical protein